jgi:hypothetical protein
MEKLQDPIYRATQDVFFKNFLQKPLCLIMDILSGYFIALTTVMAAFIVFCLCIYLVVLIWKEIARAEND